MLDLRVIGVLARPDNDAFAGIANIQNAGTWDMVPCQYAFRSGFKEISHFVNFGRVENQLVRRFARDPALVSSSESVALA